MNREAFMALELLIRKPMIRKHMIRRQLTLMRERTRTS